MPARNALARYDLPSLASGQHVQIYNSPVLPKAGFLINSNKVLHLKVESTVHKVDRLVVFC